MEYVEPGFVMRESALYPKDLTFKTQYRLRNTGQAGGRVDADIDDPEIWSRTANSTAAIVAVVDSGNCTRHTDLRDNI